MVVRINERELEVQKNMPEAARERLSNTRLEYFLKILDIHGEAYLDLVSDLESVEAVGVMMEFRARAAWWETSWLPLDMPSDPFGKPLPVHIQIDTVTKRARHWVMEAYGRLAAMNAQAPSTVVAIRRGYRAEVRAWMKREGISSVQKAAKKLAVSDSTLKSIMSNRGDVRYSPETLAEILAKIGYHEAK